MAGRLVLLDFYPNRLHLSTQLSIHSARRHASSLAQSAPLSRFKQGPEPLRWPAIDAKIRELKKLPEIQQITAWGSFMDREVVQKYHTGSSSPIKEERISQQREVLPLAVHILEHARTTHKIDVLARAAEDMKEWLAIEPVVEILLRSFAQTRKILYENNPTPSWITGRLSPAVNLDKLVDDRIPNLATFYQQTPAVSLFRTSRTLDLPPQPSLKTLAMSQILRSLGNMVIWASDYCEDDKRHQTLMTAFVGCLAQLHHHDMIPASIYNYDAPRDPTVIARPPLLQTFWARIMTHLTHVSWNRSWILKMAEASRHGVELSPPRHQYPGEAVGNEVWLEFLLWTCIEGGWIEEAAYIISCMEHRASREMQHWSVISWEDVCKKKPPEESWRTALQKSLGSPEGTFPTHKMGARTISVEIVDATMDGLANVLSPSSLISKDAFESYVEAFRACQALLSRSGYNLDAERANGLVLRMIEEGSSLDPVSDERLYEILTLSPTLGNAQEPNEAHQASLERIDIDPSASILGLLHRNLERFAINSDEERVKKTLEFIMNIIDANRNLYIRLFASALRQKSGGNQPTAGQERRATPLLRPEVPLHVLEEVLNFVMQHGLSDLGNFLFYNDDIDESFIPSSFFSTPAMQPLLVDYATTTSDSSILARVIESVKTPVSHDLLRAFIRYRIHTHRWQEVEDIFRQLSFTQEAPWKAADVFVIARYMLRHSDSEEGTDQANVKDAYIVLNDILRGYYDPVTNTSGRPNFNVTKMANQLKRILRTVPGKLFTSFTSVPRRETGILSGSRLVPGKAFNYLLEGIVEKFGSASGQQFVDRWCLERSDGDLGEQVQIQEWDDASEKVVPPSKLIVRTVVAPLLGISTGPRLKSQQSQESQKSRKREPIKSDTAFIHRWAVEMYQKLGLDQSQLEKDLPGVNTLLRRNQIKRKRKRK